MRSPCEVCERDSKQREGEWIVRITSPYEAVLKHPLQVLCKEHAQQAAQAFISAGWNIYAGRRVP